MMQVFGTTVCKVLSSVDQKYFQLISLVRISNMKFHKKYIHVEYIHLTKIPLYFPTWFCKIWV
jgi:hypothetical protein